MKARDDKVQLIQCLLESSKGLNKDFVILSEGWHDDLHCPTEEGAPGGVFRVGVDPWCCHSLHYLVATMGVPFFCRSSRLCKSFSFGQLGRFGDHT